VRQNSELEGMKAKDLQQKSAMTKFQAEYEKTKNELEEVKKNLQNIQHPLEQLQNTVNDIQEPTSWFWRSRE